MGSYSNFFFLEFAECATGRTVSVIWACKEKYLNIQRCLQKLYVYFRGAGDLYLRWLTDNCSTTPERMDLVREEYIRQRQVARDAAVFQEAAPRAADGS